MLYIKKEYRRLLNKADREFTIPSSFKKFISENEEKHNLIIKSKDSNCICTNCSNKFKTKEKVNNYVKCPNCKQKLLVKTDRLQQYVFKDNLQLLDKIEDVFVLRTFELYSNYNNLKVSHCITEFMRTVIKGNEIKEFVTNQVHNHMGYMYITHYQSFNGWRSRNYRWAYRDVVGMVCPYNLKYMLRHTDLKYSQLDKFVKRAGYVDFIKYFTSVAVYPSFEMFMKLKLYNLASVADRFTYGKTFNEIFGLPKTYYTFIKKHNLDYKQLAVLKLLKKEDIKLINKLVDYNNLKELSKYVDLEKAYNKVLKYNQHRSYEYLDYLETCLLLGYDMKNNKVLYPRNLIEEHDKVVNLLEIVENEANDKLIKERLSVLEHNTYHNKKYIIFPANSVASLIDESKQMNNCVKTYAQKFALGKCDLYFMRTIDNPDKSLVTIEVRDGKVVQSRTKNNYETTKEQQQFIDGWEQKYIAV